ncbi:ferrous iron transport protein A [Rhodobacter sphaeroides]|jgi:ferrous iron transport protein A|uniref:Ferrous iron transport protein A n=4 Tax=Cereibacter TaxID=1653176 RepID=Q3J5G8_CERS4|nr:MULTISPECIES: FeoA family protein [Cereibacter]ABN75582.1 FeoA family protein [Cereibacter sphaeroides ATCC 17029]EKX57753.1 Ferrous iron transport protein A [Rhodobacter sp. AKP1]RDS95773.1 ferrous iron transport protein A [Cereibacter sphaeroides f. sp. denitrificans]ABA77966.1 ferrous iron transport protein A [Cereibacter sphaeroides 2.4.1]ACL99983.1 FeoA family protein [Cereibacter sphaeroides KD131]
MVLSLKDMAAGATARVTGYAPGGAAYRQKLLSMGLTPGTALRVLRVAPLGDPVVIEVRGYQLSLRKAEASALSIEETAA